MSTDLAPLLVEEQSDHELVAAHRAGAHDAFDVLCRRYRTRLVALLTRRTKDRDLAEDLAQEAMLRAYQSLDGFDTAKPMWPWLKAIGINLAIDYSRSPMCRQVPTEDDSLDTAGEATPVQDPGDTIVERSLLVTALAALNSRQRAAVGLRYLDGWSVAEIARVMGMESNAVAQLLMRSRRRLCAEYKELTREKLHAWVLPLLWPYYALRDRLDRARDALTASAPGPGLATAEAFAATAAVGAITVAVAIGSLVNPSASLAEVSSQTPHTRVEAPSQQESSAGTSKNQLVREPLQAAQPARSGSDLPPPNGEPVTTVATGEAPVQAEARVTNDGEYTWVLIEHERIDVVEHDAEDEGGPQGFVGIPCDSPSRELVCEVGALVGDQGEG